MKLLGIALLLLCTSVGASDRLAGPIDSSDRADGELSLLQVRIDHGTGCHYLLTSSGLYPRMDFNGKQICGGQVREDSLMKTRELMKDAK